MISRRRSENGDITEENVDIVGTTGNIYTVTVSYEPSCTCPDAMKGNQCKHIIYVWLPILRGCRASITDLLGSCERTESS